MPFRCRAGDRSGVDDAASGDFGNAVNQFVVGFNGGEGVHLLDSNGKMVWRREDGNVWHVEIVESGEHPEPLIVHSNAKGELTIRNGSGEVLARHPFEKYLSKFSITAWGTDQCRDKVITSDSSFVYIVGLDGKTIARLPARIHGDGDGETLGTPFRASNGVSYYVSLQRYELWTRSVLRVYDDHNRQCMKKCSLTTAEHCTQSLARTVQKTSSWVATGKSSNIPCARMLIDWMSAGATEAAPHMNWHLLKVVADTSIEICLSSGSSS